MPFEGSTASMSRPTLLPNPGRGCTHSHLYGNSIQTPIWRGTQFSSGPGLMPPIWMHIWSLTQLQLCIRVGLRPGSRVCAPCPAHLPCQP